MNIKRYRAATMRAALEQVKQELGADALVLETKEIRAGGILGIGAKPVVELRVVANEAGNWSEKNSSPRSSSSLPDLDSRKSETGSGGLSTATSSSKRSEPTLAAFAAQTYAKAANTQTLAGRWKSSKSTLSGISEAGKNFAEESLTRDLKDNGIEISTAPPRVVHKPPTAITARPPVVKAPPAEPKPAPPAPKQTAVEAAAGLQTEITGEMSQIKNEIRAEMRALNSSMIAMVARQVTHGDTSEGRREQLYETFQNDPEMFDSPFYEIYSVLTSAGLRPELARGAVRAGLASGSRQQRKYETVARAGLVSTLPSIVRFAHDPLAPTAFNGRTPTAIALVGPTGVGKTTTIAKLAARVVCHLRRRIELITLDTYRIAATEQLRIYAEIIGAGYHVAHSVDELDSLVRRYSRNATVLVDTAGRSPAELSDEMELGNYLSSCDELLKILVLPATTHPVDAHAAVRQFSLFGPDQLILTKLDETTRPGAAISVAGDAALPLAYLCSGQRVPEDLERATPLTLAARVVRASFAGQ